jgi:hypothetical protein
MTTESGISLSEEQKKIVYQSGFGNVRILACAGSGKTFTMICRIMHMITHLGCIPEEFFIVTFTKNAAMHICKQLDLNLKGSPHKFDHLRCGTFHALSRRILGKYGLLSAKLGNIFNVDELQWHLLDFLKSNSLASELKSQIKYIFIDEFQDVNDIQYDIVMELSKTAKGVTAIGDDNQNIYTFRGSNIKYIQHFGLDFPNLETFYLSTNYRSTAPIVHVANLSIACNKGQLLKPDSKSGIISDGDAPKPMLLNTTCGFEGVRKICDEIYELIVNKNVLPSDICILSRNNYLLYNAQAILIQKGIRTIFYSGDDNFSRGLTTEVLNRCVILSTIHASKGLEWLHVYVVGLHLQHFPNSREPNLASERRLFYVALTRAKKYLTLSNSATESSIFITELPWKKIFNWSVPLLMSVSLSPTQPHSHSVDNDGKKDEVKWIGVVDCVRMLNGSHFIYLKNNILPRDLSSLTSSMTSSMTSNEDEDDDGEAVTATKFPYQEFITHNMIESEFGTFLDCLARRMVAEYAYERFKSGSTVMTFDEIMNLFIDADAERCTGSKGDKVRSVPKKYAAPLAKAYSAYKNPENAWFTILDYIYLVSFCSSISRGRQLILYVSIRKSDLLMYIDMFRLMYFNLKKIIGEGTIKTAVTVQFHDKSLKYGLRGSIDLLIDDCIIVDFKNSLFDSNKCKLDYFLQVMLYASILKCGNKQMVRAVGIYNIIGDAFFQTDISNWTQEYEFCKYFISIY